MTVLIVDDETPIRKLVSAYLRAIGHLTLEAATECQALESVLDHRGIALVLIDAGVIRSGGEEFTLRLAELQPGIRVLFTSGHGREYLERDGSLPTGAAFLAKPFRLKALDEAVRKALRPVAVTAAG